MIVRIYQINCEKDSKCNLFMGLRNKKKEEAKLPVVDASIYEIVWQGIVECDDLEELYRIFNLRHPTDYKARSLSISDVVQVVYPFTNIIGTSFYGFYFCDTIGFTKVKFDYEEETCEKEEKDVAGRLEVFLVVEDTANDFGTLTKYSDIYFSKDEARTVFKKMLFDASVNLSFSPEVEYESAMSDDYYSIHEMSNYDNWHYDIYIQRLTIDLESPNAELVHEYKKRCGYFEDIMSRLDSYKDFGLTDSEKEHLLDVMDMGAFGRLLHRSESYFDAYWSCIDSYLDECLEIINGEDKE